MTAAATRIVHPDALEFATSHKPIIELTGKTEHVAWCGLTPHAADVLLICPCTANTLSKVALGIDDSPVTTFATTAIGSQIPIIIVPAMHLSMYKHKVVQQHISTCKKMGMTILEPALDTSKAKMPQQETIVEAIIRTVGPKDLRDKHILIIGGATAEHIDDVRMLTNRSSGKTAIALATAAYERGATVELWYGHATQAVPPFIQKEEYRTTRDLTALVKKIDKKIDCIICCAAIANFIPQKQQGKLASDRPSLEIRLTPAPRIIQSLRKVHPKATLIAFKVEAKKEVLKEKAFALLKTYHLDYVIGNTIQAFERDDNNIIIVDKDGTSQHKKGTKEELAHNILNVLR